MADNPELSEVWTGGCVCGAVRYTVRPSIRFRLYACHCTDCQKRSGSSFTLQQTVLTGDYEFEGEMIEGGFTQPSGARARLYACPKCHSRLYGTNDTRPGIAIIRAGTFDHSATLIPDVHFWTRSKQPWIVLPPDAQAMETQPDTGDGWTRLLMPRP
jgi:hypothetical protein